MGGRAGTSGGTGLLLLALLAAGCGAPTPAGPVTPPAQTPVTDDSPPPPPPPPPPPVCVGDAAAAPEPVLMQSSACLETVLEGDGSVRSRTERRFDAGGRLLSLETFGPGGVRGAYERRTLDGAGRLTALETPRVREQRTLDECGRPVEVVEQGGAGPRTSRFTYDAQGRLVGTTLDFRSAAGAEAQETRQWVYDASGRLLRTETWRSEDARLSLEVQLFDAQGRVVEERRSVTGPDRALTTSTKRTEYDAGGRVLRVTESSSGGEEQTTDYRYDEAGRLLRMERFAGAAGSGSRERRSYDARGRPTEVVTEDLGPDGSLVAVLTHWRATWAEDGSRVETYREGDVAWTHTYDARGLRVSWSESDFLAAIFEQGKAEYGRDGELLRSESQRGGGTHTWSSVEVHRYDALGRRTLTDLQTQAAGPDGATYSHTEYLRTFDEAGHLVRLEEWDLAGPLRVLLLRTEARYGCAAP
jgi:YD repeat-containing protein